jgi:hypothetical protein
MMTVNSLFHRYYTTGSLKIAESAPTLSPSASTPASDAGDAQHVKNARVTTLSQ